VGGALAAYPDEERAAGLLTQLSERIFIKALTSPLNAHIQLSNKVLIHMLETTDPEYHKEVSKVIIRMMEILYKELKKGSQESFKKKVLFKLNYAICLMMTHSDVETCTEMLKQQRKIISEGNHEMAYLLFNTQDGKMIRN